MGAYVDRIDPKTNENRKYYKADDGKLYNDYNAAASVNMSPQARAQRFLGEKVEQAKGLLGTARDNIAVPALDKAMEAGVVPANAGMFGRYLSGTEVPLTRMPKDVREGEAQFANHFTQLNEAKKTDPVHQARLKYTALVEQQKDLGVNIREHNTGLKTYPADKVAEWEKLQSKIDAVPHNPSHMEVYRNRLEHTDKEFDQNNYNNAKYNGLSSMVELNDNNQIGNATSNTLGQYTVKDGIIIDRYDFDKNNGFTTKDAPMYDGSGQMLPKPGLFTHGGAFGQNDFVQDLATQAGRISQRLGLIKPGSGYDIRLDTGRR